MQNELTLEENMELARKFVQEQFVAKGMIADLAFHNPEKEDGGIVGAAGDDAVFPRAGDHARCVEAGVQDGHHLASGCP